MGFSGRVSYVAARQVVLGWGRPSTGNSGERESEGEKEEERIGGKGEMWDQLGRKIERGEERNKRKKWE